ncbi:hypothetical protein [Botrimarina sp.]|uniref:hypothetical protein n=1 Tax=Botrimarina sp. TaxID=2795802 RepID=UPI0032ED242A
MRAEELIELLEERPFFPLRIHMSNGRTHEIRHPEMAIVGQGVVAIGVHTEGEKLPRIRHFALAHVNEVEVVTDGASPGALPNGKSSP